MAAAGTSVSIDNEAVEETQPAQKTSCEIRNMYIAAITILFFGVAMGMASAYSATATDDMKKPTSTVIPTPDEISWIGSLVALGALFGGLFSGYISSKFGRKQALVFGSLPFIIGWLAIAHATDVNYIYAGRLLTGMCIGLVCVTTPAYLVEISTPEVRGLLGASFQLFVVIGVLAVTILGSILPWNWQAVAAAFWIMISLIAILRMPESPRWLVIKGSMTEAIFSMKWLQGPDIDAASECMSMNREISEQPNEDLKFKEFLNPSVYRPAFLAVGLVFFQQACGSNAVLFYTVAIFKESGSTMSPNVASIIVDVVLVVATVVSTVLMDKAGRKILLIVSGMGMGLSLAILGGFAYHKTVDPKILSSFGWLPLVCLMVYIAAFSLGFGPIPWLMMAEMSPVRYRSFIGGGATAFCWFFVFVVTKTFGNLQNAVHDYGAYWLYAILSILGCVFAVLCLPETKGKSIEEIQQYFSSKPPKVSSEK